jgi:hypothetical protein
LFVVVFLPFYQSLQRTSIDGVANLREPTYLAVKILDFPAAMPLPALLSANRGARSLSTNYRRCIAEILKENASDKNIDILKVPLPGQKNGIT